MLEINSLTFSYDQKPLINNFSYQFKEDNIYGIKGASGCGKTTLLKIISAIIKDKYQGEVLVKNFDVSKLTQISLVDEIGYIMQNPENQFVCLDVYDELVFGLENKCFTNDEINKRLNHLLSYFPIEHLLQRSLEQLSFGQKQLVAIASILLMEPYILLCDEIYSALDYQYIAIVNQALNNYKQQHIVIMVEHNPNNLQTCDEIVDLESLCLR